MIIADIAIPSPRLATGALRRSARPRLNHRQGAPNGRIFAGAAIGISCWCELRLAIFLGAGRFLGEKEPRNRHSGYHLALE